MTFVTSDCRDQPPRNSNSFIGHFFGIFNFQSKKRRFSAKWDIFNLHNVFLGLLKDHLSVMPTEFICQKNRFVAYVVVKVFEHFSSKKVSYKWQFFGTVQPLQSSMFLKPECEQRVFWKLQFSWKSSIRIRTLGHLRRYLSGCSFYITSPRSPKTNLIDRSLLRNSFPFPDLLNCYIVFFVPRWGMRKLKVFFGIVAVRNGGTIQIYHNKKCSSREP